ncbi:putative MFS family arabinose efflux permease [Motilibacter rhizosphaerae]|uniref:Putative MFS family arabinose efflux permease n=1 Tax=Motilibacter rhizosphaerae TaxID=598652 RepID=A0A4Q7N799_9ACTN|nr:MFS transporter [Motilibacter rhizosphaerae]RZS77561.1 putative MFS family arabinose efflux permease [Motilibacter rhizosphaerae]
MAELEREGRAEAGSSTGADRSWHPAWTVFAVTFVVLIAVSAVRAVPGVLLVPWQQDRGWSRALTGGAVAVNLALFGFIGPVAAAAMVRFGVRRVVSTALLLLAVTSAGSALMGSAWELVALWGVLIGLGTGFMSTVLGVTVAQRWFVRHQGLVLGLLAGATAAGQLVLLPVLAAITDVGGWRTTVVVVGLLALAAIPLVLWRLHDSPERIGATPYGAEDVPVTDPLVVPGTGTAIDAALPAEEIASAARGGNPFVDAVRVLRRIGRRREFLLLTGAFFVCGLSSDGLLGPHFVAACVDHGFTQVAGAGLLALTGAFDVLGTLLAGWLTDRMDPRRLLFWVYWLRGLGLVLLPGALGATPGLLAFAVVFGLDWSATVPPTVALSRRSFGADDGLVAYGWMYSAHQLGAALASWSAGIARTALGTYTDAFVAAGMLAMAAAFASQGVRRHPPALVGAPEVG